MYSKSVLGSQSDLPGVFVKKQRLLESVGLCDRNTKIVRVTSVEELLVLSRIIHFSEADLQICRDYNVGEIYNYSNPCNLKRALLYVPSVLLEESGESSEEIRQLEAIWEGKFHPSPVSANIRPSPENPGWSISTKTFVRSTAHGCSLFAKEQIPRGSDVLCLPSNIPISILSPFRDSKFPASDLMEQGMHPDSIFLLYLIQLRRDCHALPLEDHRTFFQCQPNNYGTLFERPAAFLAALDEPDLVNTVNAQNCELMDLSKSLSPSFTFEELLWAKSLCTSRAFSLPVPVETDTEKRLVSEFYPDGRLTTLLPYIHFFNHNFYGQCDTPTVDGSIKALVDIKAGEEIFINYGGFNNKQLMLNYGFFVPENPYDRIAYEVGTYPEPSVYVPGSREFDPTLSIDEKSLIEQYLIDRNRYS